MEHNAGHPFHKSETWAKQKKEKNEPFASSCFKKKDDEIEAELPPSPSYPTLLRNRREGRLTTGKASLSFLKGYWGPAVSSTFSGDKLTQSMVLEKLLEVKMRKTRITSVQNVESFSTRCVWYLAMQCVF